MATLYCPCGQAHELWAEFWWTEGRHRWIFFDYEQTSETYAEQVENCPACGSQERRGTRVLLRGPGPFVWSKAGTEEGRPHPLHLEAAPKLGMITTRAR